MPRCSLLALLVFAGCLADLRPPPLDARSRPLDEAGGREVLRRAHDALRVIGRKVGRLIRLGCRHGLIIER